MTSFIETNTMEELAHIELTKDTESWQITDLGSANWALKLITTLQKKIRETDQLASTEMARIQEWQAKETGQYQQQIMDFEMKLSDYLRELRKTDKKARIKTPYGTVSTRKIDAKINYQKQAIDELEEKGLDAYIRIKKEIDVANLKSSDDNR